MTEATSGKRRRVQVNALGAVLIASAIAGLALYLLLLPIREPERLTPVQPRPELLDKPHRQAAPAPTQAAPTPTNALPLPR